MAFERPLKTACALCPAHIRSAFSEIQPRQADVFDRMKQRRSLAAGETLFRQGEPSEAIYCVSSGLVGRRMLHENGATMLAGLVEAGDVLGAAAFLSETAHASTAEALSDVELCIVPRAEAMRLSQEQPEIHAALVMRCIGALQAAEAKVLAIAALPSHARLCQVLLDFAERAPHSGDSERRSFDLPISRGDLAALLGVQPESLSRLLRRAVDEEVVALSGRRVSVASMSRLRVASQGGRRCKS